MANKCAQLLLLGVLALLAARALFPDALFKKSGRSATTVTATGPAAPKLPIVSDAQGGICMDHIRATGHLWRDAKRRSCSQYGRKGGMLCASAGHLGAQSEMTANEACCVCGGGVRTVEQQRAHPTELLQCVQGMAAKRVREREHLWIVFMGDSNMRGAWTEWTRRLQGHVHAPMMTKIGLANNATYAARWSDQEFLAKFNGGELRASMRFLHDSEKVENVFADPHPVRLAGSFANATKEEIDAYAEKMYNASDPKAVRPSNYAVWATSFNTRIDTRWGTSRPELHARIAAYADRRPDLFILSQAWGGHPRCITWDATLSLFKKYPESRIVWAPVWVTDRRPSRKQCFAPKLKSQTATGENYRVLDFVEALTNSGLPETADVIHPQQSDPYIMHTWDRVVEAVCKLAE